MSPENRTKLIEMYFGQHGHRYHLVRTHIDSCDFALGQYAAVTDAAGITSPEDVFSIPFDLERDETYLIPMIKDAEQALGKPIAVLLSPWSPPAFMKTNQSRLEGGRIKPEYRAIWAAYLCRYVLEYRARGIHVTMLTIQNEPNATQSWDSCRYDAQEEKEFLRDYLHPALAKAGLADLDVLIWDHNKERMWERADAIIDETTDTMIAGVAFHWYTGDHFDAISLVRNRFQAKKLIHTEGCVEYSRMKDHSALKKAQHYASDLIGDLNAGMHAYLDWNILLDQEGGPNHVQNFCDAPVIYDVETDTILENLSFSYLGHFSKFILPGAIRIACTKYTKFLEMVAFRNLDGSMAIVLLNPSEEDIPVSVRMNGQVVSFAVQKNSIATGVITK